MAVDVVGLPDDNWCSSRRKRGRYFLRFPLKASMSACIRRLCSAAQSPGVVFGDALGAGTARRGAAVNLSIFRAAT
jgi:hypothetical protein